MSDKCEKCGEPMVKMAMVGDSQASGNERVEMFTHQTDGLDCSRCQLAQAEERTETLHARNTQLLGEVAILEGQRDTEKARAEKAEARISELGLDVLRVSARMEKAEKSLADWQEHVDTGPHAECKCAFCKGQRAEKEVPTAPKHYCNLSGFDELKGDVCPACEAEKEARVRKGQR